MGCDASRTEPTLIAAMRELSATPQALFDPVTGRPRTGSFVGGLPRVDWGPLALGTVARVLRHKKWLYIAVATDEVYVALAVACLGYASNAFVYAYEARAKRMLFRRSWLSSPFAASVGEAGCSATFLARDGSIAVDRSHGGKRYGVHVEGPGIALSASLDAEHAPPAIGAVAEVAPGRFDATEKRALLDVRGEVRAGGRSVSLDGGFAAYDFTSGILARRTRWRWGFALGRVEGGRVPFAINLVEGFVGEAECAAWIGSELVGLREGRFKFDPANPASPWRVSTVDGDAVDLTMTPGAVHEERRELGVVASRFVQPCGSWSGTLSLPGRPPLAIERVLGVTEDQDVRW